ncbi:hypothetical protein M5X06_04520 [Paenibacillus alvei]|uniref:Bacteriophage SP-beta YorD domain-containing protein n=1 Tax=Paenibacillus alvei TaxID=44250 RepID=A0ABT4H220_PAEAL|nr:hypothetical protein [Paenibacillus alvei]MCY9763027.1 hypothetical protein [Paenibacillus alvei]MCY9766103.1 hypothetical protein [Paenibacillus alvei]
MKEAIITDLNGRYIEPTLVADSVTGVFDKMESIQSGANDAELIASQQNDDNLPTEAKTKLVGYTVAIPLPDGLYEPTFDVHGYRKAKADYDLVYVEYLGALAKHDPSSGKPAPQRPTPVDASSYWSNGLTEEEIEALQPEPVPTELDQLRIENAKLLLHVAELEAKSDKHLEATNELQSHNAALTQDHATLLLQLAEKGVI